jgi:O-antigen/teichoic acid export membrane protein
MKDSHPNHSGFVKDMSWYLIGTIIPMGVGFIKTPVFTRYFTPEEFGYLGLITITFSYISVFFYSWLSGCLWRYYNAYKEKNDLKGLYSNLFLIFTSASAVLFIVSVVWYFLAESSIVRQLILLSFAQYLIREIIGLYLIVARLEGKALKYNLIHSMRAVLSFVVLYIMAFGFHFRITSMLSSAIAVDVIALIFLLATNREGILISLRNISKPILKVLLKFGSVGLISNFCFLLVSSSDRYIIALFTDMSSVGIYNQVYSICQLSVVALVTVYFNTINPRLNRELEINFPDADVLLSHYLYAFLLLGLPLVTLLSLFSKEISVILLGEEFRSGYTIMPYVFVSSFLYGMFMFTEIKFKFADKLSRIVLGVIFASILNIVLNLILIPLYGYLWAAITTLAAYLFLVLYFYIQDSLGFFKNKDYLKTILAALAILVGIILADRLIRIYYDPGILPTIAEGILFLGLYILIFKKKIKSLKIPV